MPRRRPVSQETQPRLTSAVAYKRYLISPRTDGRVSISKDSFHIGSESSVESARKLIDFLTSEEKNNPGRRRRRKRSARAMTRRNPMRKPRGVEGPSVRFLGESVRVRKNGGYVQQLKYEDANDRQLYVHDFEDLGAYMYLCDTALGKAILIVPGDGETPLWENA